jgi:hypothetical protein
MLDYAESAARRNPSLVEELPVRKLGLAGRGRLA